jgi:chitodextrinase
MAAPVDCTSIDRWQPTAIYTDTVIQSESLYEAKWWTTNENPTTTGQWGVWNLQGECNTTTNNVPPTVEFTSPSNNSSVQVGQSVAFAVDANDSDGTIISINFYVNNQMVTSSWVADAAGRKQLKAVLPIINNATAKPC